MFAELVINIEAGLQGTFHYRVPRDMRNILEIGHLVEVEFGRQLAQGIIVAFGDESPVEETKPIIGLIDLQPVVRPWQIELAEWLSGHYLAPLNACLRLTLPPGLTRWADITLDLNPRWDGKGVLTDTQRWLVALLQEKGDLRGRQINRARPKGGAYKDWRNAANQLVRRDIVRRASILDPPRVRPKRIRTASLSASPVRIREAAMQLGRSSKQADVLAYLLASTDPLPLESQVIAATGTREDNLKKLESANKIRRTPAETLVTASMVTTGVLPNATPERAAILRKLPAPISTFKDSTELDALIAEGIVELVDQPPTVALPISVPETVAEIYRLRNAQKYYAVLGFLTQEARAASLSEIYRATGTSMYHLRRLAQLEMIKFGQEEVWRDPLADRDFVPSKAPRLASDQAAVWEQISREAVWASGNGGDSVEWRPGYSEDSSLRHSPVFLLHGVTGSGKTEIYMKAVDFALSQGKSAIILVPEIALTPQTVRRFAARFPGQVAVLHSRLSDGERYDTWRRAREGRFKIVVGPRSALFTPLDDLGIIVVDEEHDDSYKQTPPVPPPYYHARDVAIELARIVRATVILGSATPDLVSYHRAQAGQYQLLELPKRIMGHRQRIESQAARLQLDSRYSRTEHDPEEALTIPLPPVQVVDLRQELRAGNRSIFSRALRKQLTETLERGEQAILFLNRRGTATFVICRDCGLVLQCPRCDSPLTYHRPGMMLVCHYCGRKEQPHETCPQCGSHRIRYFGLGTEEVERRVQVEWPEARTVRWDRDTTAGRDRHEILLSSFINQEADILVGTQMIAKGLDLPLVTLVGVISADVSLGMPDFSTGERTFQLMAQVAGRAGRGLLGGKVILQTYQPNHYAIQAAADHDYDRFYLEEIRFRTIQGLPPFRRMAKLVVADPINERAEREAKRLTQELSRHIRENELQSTEFFGPIPPFFNRLDGRFRWQIIIRSPDPVRLLEGFRVPANWVLEIDPVSTL